MGMEAVQAAIDGAFPRAKGMQTAANALPAPPRPRPTLTHALSPPTTRSPMTLDAKASMGMDGWHAHALPEALDEPRLGPPPFLSPTTQPPSSSPGHPLTVPHVRQMYNW